MSMADIYGEIVYRSENLRIQYGGDTVEAVAGRPTDGLREHQFVHQMGRLEDLSGEWYEHGRGLLFPLWVRGVLDGQVSAVWEACEEQAPLVPLRTPYVSHDDRSFRYRLSRVSANDPVDGHVIVLPSGTGRSRPGRNGPSTLVTQVGSDSASRTRRVYRR